jgi:hypothetical protein
LADTAEKMVETTMRQKTEFMVRKGQVERLPARYATNSNWALPRYFRWVAHVNYLLKKMRDAPLYLDTSKWHWPGWPPGPGC